MKVDVSTQTKSDRTCYIPQSSYLVFYPHGYLTLWQCGAVVYEYKQGHISLP